MITDISISKIKQMDGTLLLVFRDLVQTHNATKTARRLNMSQSAVSAALSRLRALFEDPLFVRQAHGLTPTTRAIELSSHVDHLIEIATEAFGLDENFDPARSKRVFRIASPEFIAASLGGALTRSLHKLNSELSITFRYMAFEPAIEKLARGQIDMVLGRFGKAPTADTAAVRIYTDAFCVVARKHHPNVRGSITKAQYHSLQHVFATSISEILPDEMDPGFRPKHSVIYVPQWLTALSIAATSNALATCPRSLAESHAPLLDLQILKPPFVPKKFTVSALTNSDRKDAGVQWLLDMVRQSVIH